VMGRAASRAQRRAAARTWLASWALDCACCACAGLCDPRVCACWRGGGRCRQLQLPPLCAGGPISFSSLPFLVARRGRWPRSVCVLQVSMAARSQQRGALAACSSTHAQVACICACSCWLVSGPAASMVGTAMWWLGRCNVSKCAGASSVNALQARTHLRPNTAHAKGQHMHMHMHMHMHARITLLQPHHTATTPHAHPGQRVHAATRYVYKQPARAQLIPGCWSVPRHVVKRAVAPCALRAALHLRARHAALSMRQLPAAA
jgi:hypothetical protein